MILFRKAIILRAFAIFCLLEISTSIVAPTLSYALTAGPTAPEATSFEPVDTTDLVNLGTGDLSYTVPLIDVPGPGGGYPLALAYHAAIMPDLDASWVGLGFSLNAGAINRSVSGFADDTKNSLTSTREFWEGGSSSTVTIGATVSSAGGAGVSAGLVFSDDTYKGRGIGHYYGANARIGGGASVSHTRSVSPYGDKSSSTGIGVGIGQGIGRGLKLGANLGISVNQNGDMAGRVSGGLSGAWKMPAGGGAGASLLGASISTSQSSVSISAGGVSASGTRTNSGNVSTKGYDVDVDIPISATFSLRLGKSYQRYWIDKVESVYSNGALYFPKDQPTSQYLDTHAYDIYDLQDADEPLEKSVPDESQSGSFFDYDNFNVVAQGLGGTIRPYHYLGGLVRKNRKEAETAQVKSYPIYTNKAPHFRFIGDFSNRFEHNRALDQLTVNASNSSNPLQFSFDSNRKTGESGSEAYNPDTNILPGSKNIEWFTNSAIIPKLRDSQGNTVQVPDSAAVNKGFVDCKAAGFAREANDKIGGFKITNESGVSYHYALPVYASDEKQYSGQIDDAGKHKFNYFKNTEPYAYTWLLTALTGPDYVDVNLNGFADEGDYGYWVNFNYGRWTGSFDWRNPGVNFNKDIDQNFDNFSKGVKELYYLNSISTQTHTALFVKGFRYDGKSVVPEMTEAVRTGPDHVVRDVDNGGFDPKPGRGGFLEYPTSTLKLSRVYLMLNKDLPGGAAATLNDLIDNSGSTGTAPPISSRQFVLDSLDVTGASSQLLLSKAIKSVEFITDYSLCPQTDNSYISPRDATVTGATASLERKGKLTLKSIRTYGRNGVSLLPPTTYTYGKEEKMSGRMNNDGNSMRIDYGDRYNIKKGDIFRFRHEGKDYFCYADGRVYGDYTWGVTPINYTQFPGRVALNTVIVRTKNPPYSPDRHDMWGYYKVDWAYNSSTNIAGRVSTTSAAAVDAWSLTEVSNALGSKITFEYESDQYRNSLKSLSNIPIKLAEASGTNKTKLTLYENLSEYGLKAGDGIKFRLLSSLRYEVGNPQQATELRFNCNGSEYTYALKWINQASTATILSVFENTCVINFDFKMGFPTSQFLFMDKNYPYDMHETYSGERIPMTALAITDFTSMGGEIITLKPLTPYGGGLRVKKVNLVQAGMTRSTLYSYEQGTTTYEPMGMALPVRKLLNMNIYQCLESLQQEAFNDYREFYRTDIYKKFKFLFANSRELPGPNVMYGRVTIEEQIERPEGITKIPGKTVMDFEVFSPETVGVEGQNPALALAFNSQYGSQQDPSLYVGSWNPTAVGNVAVDSIMLKRNMVVKDFSSIMGSLKRTTLYDGDNNKISETINNYLHDDFSETGFLNKLDSLNNQGVIMETFADARAILQSPTANPKKYSLYASISQKIKYPSIQVGTTTTNFKTGITTKEINKSFDYYSGNVKEVVNTDGYGNAFLTKTVPAYRSYGGITGGMGLGAYGGKNMLVQESESWVLKVDHITYDTLGVLSGSVQTWSDDIPVLVPGSERTAAQLFPGIWRKHAKFVFGGEDDQPLQDDGLYPLAGVTAFNRWNIDNTTAQEGWDRVDEQTLYDVYSNSLEEGDFYGNFSAVKMSKKHELVFASGVNGRYEEIAYSGAEEDVNTGGKFGGDVIMRAGSRTSLAHTGKYGVLAGATAPNNRGFSYAFKPQKRAYRVSVWSNQPAAVIKYKFDGAGADQNGNAHLLGQAGDWYLFESEIAVTGTYNSLDIWCESAGSQTAFDDFRVFPKDGNLTSYVYNDQQNVTFILGVGNLFTEFRYDEAGRLISTLAESFQRNYGNEGRPGIVQMTSMTYNYGVNAPRTVAFQASAAGATGAIYPGGTTQVPLGKDVIFDIHGICPNNLYLQTITIDGVQIDRNTPQLLLGDGTLLEISTQMLKFKKVQAGHTISVNFGANTELGVVECVKGVPLSDGTACYNGEYRYAYYDACGEPVAWTYVWQKQDIPANLRALAVNDCCALNIPSPYCHCPDY